jgi:hypothetical protein
MKRHPSLTAFSDDHHQGLVHARQLRKAASGEGDNSADTARNFLEFWQVRRRRNAAHSDDADESHPRGALPVRRYRARRPPSDRFVEVGRTRADDQREQPRAVRREAERW